MQRLMITVTGLTPAVVTETLWAVLHEPAGAAGLPERIFLLTTADGKKKMTAELLGPNGALARFCADYGIDPVIPVEIRVVKGADGRDIEDIRTAADSIAAADAIVHAVRAIAQDFEDAAIHASLAGGRKTMSFHLGYAMSLFGKEGDRLTHVLVSPPTFEVPGFHFIPRDRGIIDVPDRNSPTGLRSLNTAEARIDLADIPFIRLRPHLKGDLRKNILESKAPISHEDIVRGYQVSLAGIDALVLDDATCSVEVRAGAEPWTVSLPPRAYALYRMYAEARQSNRPGAGPEGAGKDHTGWIPALDWLDVWKFAPGQSVIETYGGQVERLVKYREISEDVDVKKRGAIQQDSAVPQTLRALIDRLLMVSDRHWTDHDQTELVRKQATDYCAKSRTKANERLKNAIKHEAIYRHVEIANVANSRHGLRLDGSRIQIKALAA